MELSAFNYEPYIKMETWRFAQEMHQQHKDWYALKMKLPNTTSQYLAPSSPTHDGIDDSLALNLKRKANSAAVQKHVQARYKPAQSEMAFDEHMGAQESHYR